VDQRTDIAKVTGAFLQLSIAKASKEVQKRFLEMP
jgi:hypothetical protein